MSTMRRSLLLLSLHLTAFAHGQVPQGGAPHDWGRRMRHVALPTIAPGGRLDDVPQVGIRDLLQLLAPLDAPGVFFAFQPGDLGVQDARGSFIPLDHSVLDALQMALDRRRPPAGVIFHSDRGTQYTSQEFADFCRKNDIRRSLGRTGVCWDNAVAESFFATYKKELIHNRPWPTINQLKTETFSWIEAYYNRTRRHSTLDYLTPSEYELGYRNIHELAA